MIHSENKVCVKKVFLFFIEEIFIFCYKKKSSKVVIYPSRPIWPISHVGSAILFYLAWRLLLLLPELANKGLDPKPPPPPPIEHNAITRAIEGGKGSSSSCMIVDPRNMYCM
jgi:hypothetical protein